jgi:hypothetical protein
LVGIKLVQKEEQRSVHPGPRKQNVRYCWHANDPPDLEPLLKGLGKLYSFVPLAFLVIETS